MMPPGIMRMQRKTRQLEIIRDVFSRNPRPLKPDEVLAYARAEWPRLGQATVYRNLRKLHEEGWLVTVSHPEGGTLYEPAGGAHHHHFYCRACGRLFVLPGCMLDGRKSAPTGFRTEGHLIYLYGACSNCSSGQGGG